MKSNADRISGEARDAHETVKHFRAEVEEQFAKIMDEMRGFERYAASYGEYVPRLEVDLDYEKFLAEKRAEKETGGCDEAVEGEESKERVGDVAEPTLLGCGFSKSNLSKLFGIKFMEDAAGQREERPAAVATVDADVASPQMPPIAVSAQMAAQNELPSNSPFLSTDEDTSSPVPILKAGGSKLQDRKRYTFFKFQLYGEFFLFENLPLFSELRITSPRRRIRLVQFLKP